MKRRKAESRVGETYGQLKILSVSRAPGARDTYAKCLCDCGNNAKIRVASLANGHAKSCGCAQPKAASKANSKHGKYKDKIYCAWEGMIQRCTNKRNISYKNYGARGIDACNRWQIFENFYSDMGDVPEGLSLDRINNDSGYSKENCRWATQRQQKMNTRIRVDNTSGARGVAKIDGRFRVSVCGKHIGMFNTIDEAKVVANQEILRQSK